MKPTKDNVTITSVRDTRIHIRLPVNVSVPNKKRFWGYRWTLGSGGFIGEVTVFPVYHHEGSHPRRSLVWELTDLYVHPARRGRGWAHQLLRDVCRWADGGNHTIRLYINAYGTDKVGPPMANRNLRALYSSWGWHSTGRRAWANGAATMVRLPLPLSSPSPSKTVSLR